MALQTSGAISFANIQTEFGGSNPISLSEYYGGGTYVPAGANPGIATSGAINMNSFYGGVAATVLTISANVNNYDIGARAIAAGGDKSTPVILTINAGVTVGSTSSGTAAMYTGTGWSSGTTINITNNGSIVGASGSSVSQTGSQTGTGGNGGNGFSVVGWPPISAVAGSSGSTGAPTSDAGANGGNAFYHSQTSDTNLSVIFDTAGTRSGGTGGTITAAGGGGGGGGGGSGTATMRITGGGGGGGGAGTGAGSGGTGGFTQNSNAWERGNNGSAGSSTSGGGGGTGGVASGLDTGRTGGHGGALGSSGSPGGTGGWSAGKAGGSAGSSGSISGSAGSALAGNTGQIS